MDPETLRLSIHAYYVNGITLIMQTPTSFNNTGGNSNNPENTDINTCNYADATMAHLLIEFYSTKDD